MSVAGCVQAIGLLKSSNKHQVTDLSFARECGPASGLHGGFWNGAPLVPTAAQVDLGGRVTTADGRPIQYARISLTEASGTSHSAITNPFGAYTFSGIAAGQSVLISVAAKGFTFEEPTVAFNVSDSSDELNFSAL